MAPAPPERASGNRSQRPSYGPSGMEDHPLTDGHLSAVLGAADADRLAFISILALSGMRPDELRRLRVAHCGHGVFQVGAHVENHGPREVPIHSFPARTTIRLVRGRAGDAFLIRDGAESGPAPSPMQRQFDACLEAVGAVRLPPTIHGLRRWFVEKSLGAGQPPDTVATVVGAVHPHGARWRPEPTWGQRCACVEAVHLPRATL
jgi:integrase